MLARCRSWTENLSLAGRYETISTALDSVVALPERLNIELCVDIVYSASRLMTVALTPQSQVEMYLCVVSAARQVVTSFKDRETKQRWLTFHPGGEMMVQNELIRLVCLLRDAPTKFSSDILVAFIRVCTLAVSRCLIGALSPSDLDAISSLFPGDAVSFCLLMVKDSRLECRYSKRGFLDSKASHEATLGAQRRVQLEAIRFVEKWLEIGAAGGTAKEGDFLRCVDSAVTWLRGPLYKCRDVNVVPSALRLLSTCVRLCPGSLEPISKFIQETLPTFDCPSRDDLKSMWTSSITAPLIPLWHSETCQAYTILVLNCGLTHELMSLLNHDSPVCRWVRDAIADYLITSHCVTSQVVSDSALRQVIVSALICGDTIPYFAAAAVLLQQQIDELLCTLDNAHVRDFVPQDSPFTVVEQEVLKKLDSGASDPLWLLTPLLQSLMVEVLIAACQVNQSTNSMSFGRLKEHIHTTMTTARAFNFNAYQTEFALCITSIWKKLSTNGTTPEPFLSLLNDLL